MVSSREAVPTEQFLKLSQEQHRIQHSGEYTHPKWFIPNTLKYYVLLHDISEGDEQRCVRACVRARARVCVCVLSVLIYLLLVSLVMLSFFFSQTFTPSNSHT